MKRVIIALSCMLLLMPSLLAGSRDNKYKESLTSHTEGSLNIQRSVRPDFPLSSWDWFNQRDTTYTKSLGFNCLSMLFLGQFELYYQQPIRRGQELMLLIGTNMVQSEYDMWDLDFYTYGGMPAWGYGEKTFRELKLGSAYKFYPFRNEFVSNIYLGPYGSMRGISRTSYYYEENPNLSDLDPSPNWEYSKAQIRHTELAAGLMVGFDQIIGKRIVLDFYAMFGGVYSEQKIKRNSYYMHQSQDRPAYRVFSNDGPRSRFRYSRTGPAIKLAMQIGYRFN